MVRVEPWGAGHTWPDYGEGGLLTVPRTVEAFLAGAEGPGPVPLEDARVLVVLVVDGLGWHQLEHGLEAGVAPHLAALRDRGGLVRRVTVLPSTTASALVSLSTGLSPARHGYLGYRLFLRERGCLGDMLQVRVVGTETSLEDLGFRPEDLVAGTPLLGRAAGKGVRGHAVTRQEFLGSPFTRLLYRGSALQGYRSLAEMGDLLATLCRGGQRAVVYAYWDDVDQACHFHGSTSEAFRNALRDLDRTLARALPAEGPGDVRLLLTADHGHRDCPPHQVWDVAEDPALRELLALPPTGDARLPYLHARTGRLSRLLDYLDDRGETTDWIPADEAWEAGLFGPDPDPRWRDRVGDVILLPREAHCLIDSALPGPRDFRARHGGTSPQEMEIPLLWASLSPAGS